MGIRYIGAKTKITHEILRDVRRLVPAGGTVADLMCGSGAISLELRRAGYRVVANDVMRQAFHVTRAKLLLQEAPDFAGARTPPRRSGQQSLDEDDRYAQLLHTMNALKPIPGYFWREFSPGGRPENGSKPRKYFSSENAARIDAVRSLLRKLASDRAITDVEHSLLLNDLIMAANDVANIAGTYGHYLSSFVPRALEPIRFQQSSFVRGGPVVGHLVLNGRAEDVAESLKADLCYLDPPYKKRQYAANYHIPETIAKEDEPPAIGLSGLRPWRDEYSDFCSKVRLPEALDKVVQKMECDDFLMSYSSEGLLPIDRLVDQLQTHGEVRYREFRYKRFKSRNEEEAPEVTEYVIHLRKADSHPKLRSRHVSGPM